MSDFPRYTQGGIGPKSRPLTFAHVNRITDAAAKVEAMAEGGERRAGHRRSFFASLVQTVSTIDGRSVWSWSQVGVTQAGDQLASVQGLIASDLFQDGNGLAVEMGSGSVPGDIVLIHELVSFDGKRRYAFSRGGSANAFAIALYVESQLQVEANRWQYSVTEGRINSTGGFDQNGNSGVMWNLYEYPPFGHGQQLVTGNGTLTPSFLQGVVWGGLAAIEDGDPPLRVYICDTANPMLPECSTTPPGQAASSGDVIRQAYGRTPYHILIGGI